MPPTPPVPPQGHPDRMGEMPKPSNKYGIYDPTLQMFAQAPRDPDLTRLGFLRWLAERGLLEHPAEGPSSGEYARPK